MICNSTAYLRKNIVSAIVAPTFLTKLKDAYPSTDRNSNFLLRTQSVNINH
jgi:hypothetical protein